LCRARLAPAASHAETPRQSRRAPSNAVARAMLRRERMGGNTMRAMIKWTAVAVTAVLFLGGCLAARARHAEGATEQIFSD